MAVQASWKEGIISVGLVNTLVKVYALENYNIFSFPMNYIKKGDISKWIIEKSKPQMGRDR